MQLLIVVSAPDGVDSPAARAVGTEIVDQLRRSPHVASVTSAWTAPPPAAAALVSRDGKSGLIVAGITGGESNAQKYAEDLSDQVAHDRDGVTVRSGGVAMVNVQITEQSQHDLLLMESIAIPLSFLVLVWVFGGLLAAALPVAVGGMAILGALAVLRVTTFFTDVSIFALNLSTAMGLALAIDYTLLIISRFRDELADGREPRRRARSDHGDGGPHRVVLGHDGRAVDGRDGPVPDALPEVVRLRGSRHRRVRRNRRGRGDTRGDRAARRSIGLAGRAPAGPPCAATGRNRCAVPSSSSSGTARRSSSCGTPFPSDWPSSRCCCCSVRRSSGCAGDSPTTGCCRHSASAHQVGDQLRTDFANDSATAVTVVIPDADGLTDAEIDRYAADLSRVPDVSAVSAPAGTFVDGHRVGPPSAPTGQAQGSAFLTVDSTAPLFSDSSEAQLDRLHAVPAAPAAGTVELAGTAQINRDSVDAITSRLPLVLGLIAVIMFVLLFLLTGSVVMPLKALVLNVLSLTAAFGAMVWIFQDGHLGGARHDVDRDAGRQHAGAVVLHRVRPVDGLRGVPGLPDPRVLAGTPGRTRADNDESVALGIARTGRVITAAALVMSISFAALIAAQVSFMRMFGLGLTLAVLVDATLVRMVLLPAFMHVMGEWNWWAPKSLVWLHERFGISDGHAVGNRQPTPICR